MKSVSFIFVTLLLALTLGFIGNIPVNVEGTSLSWLKPSIEMLSQPGQFFLQQPLTLYLAGIIIISLLAIYFTISICINKNTTGEERAFVLFTLISIVFQLIAIYQNNPYFCFGPVLAASAYLMTYRFRSPLQREVHSPISETLTEYIFPLGLIFLAAIFRFYSLNSIHPNFEGELSPYYLGATSLQGIVIANEGIAGPWAPLGYLFYPPIYLTIKFFGPSTYSIRVASALVSLGTYAILFLVARKLFNRNVGLLALAFIAIDSLQIGWSRTDVHPHAVTTWMTLLIVLATYAARSSAAWGALCILVLLQILCWQQYPSGQCAALIPFITFFLAGMLKSPAVSFPWRKAAISFCGILLWFAVPIFIRYYFITNEISLKSYFERLGPRVNMINLQERGTDQALWHSIQDAFLHLKEIVKGVFFHAERLFHQDILVAIPGFPARTVNCVVAIGALWGVVVSLRRRQQLEYQLLVSWIFVAIIPAVFSEAPYPKRCATLFPALILSSAIAYNDCFRVIQKQLRHFLAAPFIIAGLLFYCIATSIASYQWFSHRFIASDIPLEEKITTGIKEVLGPRTCISFLTTDNYAPGKFSYLLADKIEDAHIAPLGLNISVTNTLPVHLDYNQLVKDCSRTIVDPLPFYRLWGPSGHVKMTEFPEEYWQSLVVAIGPLTPQAKIALIDQAHQTAGMQTKIYQSNAESREYAVLSLSMPIGRVRPKGDA